MYNKYRILTLTPPAPCVNTHRRRSCAVRPERSARTARRSWAAPPFPCGSTWPGCPPCRWCSRCSPVGTRGGAPLTRRGRWDEGGREQGKNNNIRQVPSTESLFTKADANGSRAPAERRDKFAALDVLMTCCYRSPSVSFPGLTGTIRRPLESGAMQQQCNAHGVSMSAHKQKGGERLSARLCLRDKTDTHHGNVLQEWSSCTHLVAQPLNSANGNWMSRTANKNNHIGGSN